MLGWFRRRFLTGILALAPITITAWLLVKIFRTVDGWVRPLFARWTGFEIPGLGFVSTLLFVLAVGVLASNVIGRQVLAGFERLFQRVPLASRIYVAVKQIGDAIIGSQKNLFQRVVLFEWPRRGVWSIGFVTSRHDVGFFDHTDRSYSHIFLPTTPNPTSGYLLFVPDDDLIDLDISVEDGLKLVISGGAVAPTGLPGRSPVRRGRRIRRRAAESAD